MSESALQRQAVDYLRIGQNQGRWVFFATMSENRRSPKRAGIAKAMGLTAGPGDIIVFVMPRPLSPGIKAPPQTGRILQIEFKTDKGKLSDAQIAWQAAMKRGGFSYVVVRSLDELIVALT